MQLCNKTCPAFYRCHHLEPDKLENLLAPFNKEVLIRLFRSFLKEKVRARYLRFICCDILLRLAEGEIHSKLCRNIKDQMAVYLLNKKLAQMYELYGYFSQENNTIAPKLVERNTSIDFLNTNLISSHNCL